MARETIDPSGNESWATTITKITRMLIDQGRYTEQLDPTGNEAWATTAAKLNRMLVGIAGRPLDPTGSEEWAESANKLNDLLGLFYDLPRGSVRGSAQGSGQAAGVGVALAMSGVGIASGVGSATAAAFVAPVYPVNPASPSGNRTIALTNERQLPDGATPQTAGKGFPCTGADLDSDGTIWVGHGSSVMLPTAGFVHLSADRLTVLSQFAVTGLPDGSMQGVAIDDSDGTLFGIHKTATTSTLVHCTKSGVMLGSLAFGSTMNGLAYDNQRDCLIVLFESGVFQWRSKIDLTLIAGKTSGTAAGSNNDMLFYDPTRKELLVSGGANGVSGTVGVYDVAAASAPVLISTITCTASAAIEGVVRVGDDIITINDQATHTSGFGTPNVNKTCFYQNAFAPGVPSYTVANAAADEGANAAFVITANRNGTAGDLTGTWNVFINGTAVLADFPGGVAPSGTWTIPNGQNSVSVNVTSFDDTIQEAAETYGFNVVYGGESVATGTGTINGSDAPAGTYSAEATALFARMTTQPDTTRKGKIDDFVVALKSAGVWAKTDSLLVYAAHTAQAGLLNWLGTKPDATLAGATPPTFTVDRGFATDGASGYIALNFSPSGGTFFLQDSASAGVWVNNNAAMTNGGACLGVFLTNSPVTINPRSSSGSAAMRVNTTTATAITGVTEARGLSMGSRTASNACQFYKNGQPIGAVATSASQTRVTAQFASGANNTAPIMYQLQSFAMDIVAGGLNAAEALALYDATNTYMTAIGNQVV